ncbi:MAG: hypothetical protein IPK55_15365 [Streptococcus sp.]|nr:hypothetical protein [Streptococcus sp.]
MIDFKTRKLELKIDFMEQRMGPSGIASSLIVKNDVESFVSDEYVAES